MFFRKPHIINWYSLFLLILLVFSLFIRIAIIMQHRVPSGDEGPWLRMASRCGTSLFLESKVIEHDLYFQKKIPHPEDNRSPLYPVLIKSVQLVVKDYFTAGQLLNFAAWILLFTVAAFSLTNSIGKPATLISLMYLSLSPLFFLFSSRVYPDLLITFAFFVLLLYGRKWVRSTGGIVAFAFVTGCLILTKSTGVFILPVFLYYLTTCGKRAHFLPHLGLFTVIVTGILLPWALRNYREFGSLMYQFSEYNLYVDNFNYLLKASIPRPSLAEYVHEKGILFLLFVRPLSGIRSLLQNFPEFDEYLSLAVLPFACLGLFHFIKRKRAIVPIVLFTLPYFLFMSYIAYAVWVHRFTMILYFFLYVASGYGIAFLVQKTTHLVKNRFLALLLILTVTFLPLFTVVYPLEYYLSQRGSDADYDREIKDMLEKTKHQITSRDVIFSSYISDYCHIHDFAVVDNLGYDEIGQLTTLLNYYNVSWLMLNSESDSTLISDLRLSGYLDNFSEVSKTENIVVYQKHSMLLH